MVPGGGVADKRLGRRRRRRTAPPARLKAPHFFSNKLLQKYRNEWIYC
jgi:hypothetical protein